MSKLTEICNAIVGKTKSIKKEILILSDNFIIEREVKIEHIGNTEQLSSSEKPNNLLTFAEQFEIDNPTKYCCVCGVAMSGGSVCSDECFDKFEKL